MQGGMDAIYDDQSHAPVGLGAFAPRVPARSLQFSARQRLEREGDPAAAPEGVSKGELRG